MPEFLVTGLSELRNALIKADRVEPTQIRVMLKGIGQIVVDEAMPRLRSLIHDPRSTGQLESTLKAASTVRTASVVLGTPVRTPYAGWWEFGGPKAASKRPPNREYIKEGRVLYPTLAENREKIQEATELVVEALAQLIIDEG